MTSDVSPKALQIEQQPCCMQECKGTMHPEGDHCEIVCDTCGERRTDTAALEEKNRRQLAKISALKPNCINCGQPLANHGMPGAGLVCIQGGRAQYKAPVVDHATTMSQWTDRDMRVGDRTFPAGKVTFVDVLDHAASYALEQSLPVEADFQAGEVERARALLFAEIDREGIREAHDTRRDAKWEGGEGHTRRLESAAIRAIIAALQTRDAVPSPPGEDVDGIGRFTCPGCGEPWPVYAFNSEYRCPDCAEQWDIFTPPPGSECVYPAGHDTREDVLEEAANPWVKLLADWERENGTLAAIMPHEYEALMEKIRRLALHQSPRAAIRSLKGEGNVG